MSPAISAIIRMGSPIRLKAAKNHRGCRNGTVWVEVVDDVEADTLQPRISQKVSGGSVFCSDTGKAYTGIAARGYVHRLVNHGERQYSDGKGNHINGFEGFWGT